MSVAKLQKRFEYRINSPISNTGRRGGATGVTHQDPITSCLGVLHPPPHLFGPCCLLASLYGRWRCCRQGARRGRPARIGSKLRGNTRTTPEARCWDCATVQILSFGLCFCCSCVGWLSFVVMVHVTMFYYSNARCAFPCATCHTVYSQERLYDFIILCYCLGFVLVLCKVFPAAFILFSRCAL
jgi:hypothetical protein